MATRPTPSKDPNKSSLREFVAKAAFGLMLAGALLLMGCRTTPPSEESFRGSFDAQKLITLAQQSHALAWHATRQAEKDLVYAGFRPTGLDWEVLYYLDRLSKQLPYIGFEVERHPATPRSSSKRAYDIVAFETIRLRSRYQPSSFQPSTNKQIQNLLLMIDEMASYYEVHKPDTTP